MTRFASGSSVRPLLIGLCAAILATGTAAAADGGERPSPGQRKAARFADQAAAAADAGEAWKALALYRKAATLAPNEARYRGGLGRAYLAVNLYGSAAASFGDALALDSADGAARRGWALAQQGLGRSDVRLASYPSEARGSRSAVLAE